VSTQLDWVGAAPFIQAGFIGPRRRRQAVHDEKEGLRAELRELTSRPPPLGELCRHRGHARVGCAAEGGREADEQRAGIGASTCLGRHGDAAQGMTA
jgi:hypothetical protein